MATYGIAVPGTVVPSGSQASPAGAQGIPGSAGSAGTAGANSWTLSSASFTVPNVGSTAVMSVGDASWAVVGEYVWVATAGGSPSSPMALQVTAKTATTLTLLNPPTAGEQVSGDANNLLTLGSDSLVYLPKSAVQTAVQGQTYFDPANGLFNYDDFAISLPNSDPRYATNNSGTATLAAGTYGQGNTALKINGCVEIGTGTANSANQGIGYYWGGLVAPACYPILYGLGALTWKTRIFLESTLPTTGLSYFFRAGIGQMSGTFYGNSPIQGFFFEYSPDQNSGQWRIAYATTAAATYTNTSVAAAGDTAYNLEIDANAAWTSLTFKINGVTVATLSSGFPTAVNGCPVWAIGRGTGSAVSYKAAIDSWMINYIFSR